MTREELETKLNDVYCHFYPNAQQEILNEFDNLTERIDDLLWQLEEEHYGEDI